MNQNNYNFKNELEYIANLIRHEYNYSHENDVFSVHRVFYKSTSFNNDLFLLNILGYLNENYILYEHVTIEEFSKDELEINLINLSISKNSQFDKQYTLIDMKSDFLHDLDKSIALNEKFDIWYDCFDLKTCNDFIDVLPIWLQQKNIKYKMKHLELNDVYITNNTKNICFEIAVEFDFL